MEVLPVVLFALVGTISSFSLGVSLAGMVTEAKACSKPWEAALLEPLRPCPGIFPWELQVLLFAPADWEEEYRGCVSLIGSATVEATSP